MVNTEKPLSGWSVAKHHPQLGSWHLGLLPLAYPVLWLGFPWKWVKKERVVIKSNTPPAPNRSSRRVGVLTVNIKSEGRKTGLAWEQTLLAVSLYAERKCSLRTLAQDKETDHEDVGKWKLSFTSVEWKGKSIWRAILNQNLKCAYIAILLKELTLSKHPDGCKKM